MRPTSTAEMLFPSVNDIGSPGIKHFSLNQHGEQAKFYTFRNIEERDVLNCLSKIYLARDRIFFHLAVFE